MLQRFTFILHDNETKFPGNNMTLKLLKTSLHSNNCMYPIVEIEQAHNLVRGLHLEPVVEKAKGPGLDSNFLSLCSLCSERFRKCFTKIKIFY